VARGIRRRMADALSPEGYNSKKGALMKIAAFVNDSGTTAGFYEKGHVCLYDQVAGTWEIAKKIALDINMEMNLTEIKETFFRAMSQLEDCKVFIVREFKGLFHALLMEELGFHTWKSAGTMLEQLDNVVRQETEYVAEREKQAGRTSGYGGCAGSCSSSRQIPTIARGSESCEAGGDVPRPVLIGDKTEGRYVINLAEILQDNPALNSRQVLIPALEGIRFKKLEILCDHIPRWFHNELRNLQLTAESEAPDETGKWLKVVVSSR